MLTKLLLRPPLLILLLLSTQVLNGCQSIEIENRTAYFVNGEISLGSTSANTVGTPVTAQLTTKQTLDVLEARTATSTTAAHPPAIFQSAVDYGEETTELETACRLLKNNCSYALQSTIENHKRILDQVKLQRFKLP